MSTPNLIPQPQVTQPVAPPPVDISKVLASPEFNHLDAKTQRSLLAERYNKGIGDLNDDEFLTWKHQSAKRLGIEIPQAQQPNKFDKIIEMARPFVSDAVGAGVGALTTPISGPLGVGAGIAAKGGADMLMQNLESVPPTSYASEAAGFKPGTLPSQLTNTGEMLATNGILNKGIGTVIKGAQVAGPLLKEPIQAGKELLTGMGKEIASNYKTYIPMSIMAHFISPTYGGKAVAGIKLTHAAVSTLAKNPRTSRIIDAMTNGQPLGVSSQFAAHAISDVLNGAGMVAAGPDGDHKVVLKDGQLVPEE